MPFLYELKNKSDSPRYLWRFLLEFREQFKGCVVLRIHVLRSDNAQEFKSAEVLKILEEGKILPEYSNPREQFQNGQAEKCIGDCWAMTRSSLISPKIWPEEYGKTHGYIQLMSKDIFLLLLMKNLNHQFTWITNTCTTFWLPCIHC